MTTRRGTVAALMAAVTMLLTGCGTASLSVPTEQGTLTVTALTDDAVRVQRTAAGTAVPQLEELVYTRQVRRPRGTVRQYGDSAVLRLKGLRVCYDRRSSLLTFRDGSGNVLLQEAATSVLPAEVQGVPCVEVTGSFLSPADEHLYGTGQFQDGFLDIRGLTRRLTQVNTQIAIPLVLSSKGYGLLWNNYGLTDFNPADHVLPLTAASLDDDEQVVDATGTAGNRRERRRFGSFTGTLHVEQGGRYALLLDVGQRMARKHWLAVDGTVLTDVNNTWLPPTTSLMVTLTEGDHEVQVQGAQGDKPVLHWRRVDDTTTWHSPVATALDYTVMAGGADAVMASYRRLTGDVPPMPEWMFGYIHCRERYHSQQEIIDNAEGFAERDIPLDVIVQDWQWWGRHGWNALRFDETAYPDPKALTDRLHEQDVHLMLSVWSKVDKGCAVGRELERRGAYIPGTDWIDFFQPEAADFYWQSFRDSLTRYGIDAWWFDATEPENDDLHGRRVAGGRMPGDFYRNVYPLMVNRTMYEGLTTVTPQPVILTRSAFAGMQRYGVVTWSGDVGNDYETLRRQVVGGLGQMAAGLPWWTFDAGGFFRPWNQYDDEEYQERLVRWVQVATFLPFMRVHGYMSETEPWHYSERTQQIMTRYIRLRKELQPYIVACARRVSEEGYTLMRPLLFDFPHDEEALRQDCEYMFGSRYLVCPTLQGGITTQRVYLPATEGGWRHLFTGTHYDGGQYVDCPIDLETMAVFERE